MKDYAVVPGYYLVCYNKGEMIANVYCAVVPGYYLVCYNYMILEHDDEGAVVPGYYLVCYNSVFINCMETLSCSSRLLLGML